MSADFRALCAELLQPLAEYDGANPYHEHRDLITRARTALAQSEGDLPPKPPLHSAVDRHDLVRYGFTWDGLPGGPLLTPMPDGYWTPWHVAARLPQPIPVAERLPGEGDCALWPDEPDADPWCWAAKDVDGGWEWTQLGVSHFGSSLGKVIQGQGYTHWLPHWALPLPKGGADA